MIWFFGGSKSGNNFWCGCALHSEVEKPPFDAAKSHRHSMCAHVLCINLIENNYDIYTNNGVTM